MPNGGITPDCVHCKWYTGQPLSDGNPFCNFHKINLPVPIRAFCAHFTDVKPDDIDWLDKMLDRNKLQEKLMYVWLGGYEADFSYILLVSTAEYGQWTREKFFDELNKLTSK